MSGYVRLTEALGSEVVVHFDVAVRPAVTNDTWELVKNVGDAVALKRLLHDATMFVGRFVRTGH